MTTLCLGCTDEVAPAVLGDTLSDGLSVLVGEWFVILRGVHEHEEHRVHQRLERGRGVVQAIVRHGVEDLAGAFPGDRHLDGPPLSYDRFTRRIYYTCC